MIAKANDRDRKKVTDFSVVEVGGKDQGQRGMGELMDAITILFLDYSGGHSTIFAYQSPLIFTIKSFNFILGKIYFNKPELNKEVR